MTANYAHAAAGCFGLFAAGCVSAPAPAQAHAVPAYAGQWRFEPSRCPDLVEDWRDRRESRRDRRESRRDERVTVCPASAWVWDGPRRYRPAARPVEAAVYYDWRARHYYRYGPDRVRVTVVLR